MGKTSLCIQMLELLNTGRVYKVSELAEILETNSRNIIEYKKELEEAGYYITSVSGKYGGYKLDESSIFPSIKLSNKEKEIILEGYNYILSCNSFISNIEFQKAFSKVISQFNHNEVSKVLINYSKFSLLASKDELLNNYNLLNDAIKERKAINACIDNAEILLHPYDLFIYDNIWYVIGWNQNSCDISYYKLHKLKNIEKSKNKYNMHREYNINDYIDSNGFKNNKLIGASLVFSKIIDIDRIYGKNQIVNYENNKCHISLDIESIKDIFSLILDNYQYLELIEPVSMKNELIAVLNKINNL